MKAKKNVLLLIIGLFLIGSLFFVGYFIGGSKEASLDKSATSSLSVYDSKQEEQLDDDLCLVLKEVDVTTGDSTVKLKKTIKEFKTKDKDKITKSSLEEIYLKEGYELSSVTDKEIILVKNIEKSFEPGRYYLGEEKGFVAIFKSDDKGKLFIEDYNKDIITRKVDSLPEGDRVLLKNKQLKFETKEEAYDQIAEIES
ncbi:hypothetical protein LGK99_00025 [Clostridium algidicarnis]|uniref:hypothetical protein n=1 Tax=Clostridium algidicarnis TaxID=37659 RepID=UPI001C0C3736|nr:hypothetical protein [Clostridium algidicarnis]MBU3193554.1 hypothetical protein [Clostridium algidicarnis]MCB2285492.1 hypothetical protein [Clostridium algidicarnis]